MIMKILTLVLLMSLLVFMMLLPSSGHAGDVIQVLQNPEPLYGFSMIAYQKYILIASPFADVGNAREAGCVYVCPRPE